MDKIINKNCLGGLKEMEDNSVDCCITSPPYFGLRDYGTADQIGLEKTPDDFVIKLVEVFEEVRRVLKPSGTLWLNLGDSYSATGTGTGDQRTSNLQGGKKTQIEAGKRPSKKNLPGIKPKDLIGIPWMVAFALRSAGWYLRQDIIWAKPNPMPEPVTDRCTKSHEYIFLLSKSQKYFFDAESIKTEAKNPEADYKRNNGQKEENKYAATRQNNGIRPRKSGNIESKPGSARGCPEGSGSNVAGSVPWEGSTANKRSVWNIPTKPFAKAHFATFPQELIIDMIKAGCPEYVCNKCGKPREALLEKEYIKHENWYGDRTKENQNSRGTAGTAYNELIGTKVIGLTDCKCGEGFRPGLVLDPFMGAGTTAVVAKKLHRNYIGFELNPEYIKIAEDRLHSEIGLFK